MARYSAELYARLEEETGLSTGFRRCGYLQLATTPRADEGFRRETAYMRSVGMTKEVLSAREVADLVPLIRTDDVIHGFWTPDEGRANPVDVTMSLAKGARQRGVRIFEDTEVTDFVLDRGRVVGVRTKRGDVECEKVVLAAGLWGRELAAKAGVTVPLQAAEHYYLLTEPIAGVTPESVPGGRGGRGLRLLPGGGRRAPGRDVRAGREGVGPGRHAGGQRLRRAPARLGPAGAVPRGRDAALPSSRGRRDPHPVLRAGELHRRPRRRCSGSHPRSTTSTSPAASTPWASSRAAAWAT